MWLTLFLWWLSLAVAVDAVVSSVDVWGPRLAGLAVGAGLSCWLPDFVRARVRNAVRTLSALCSQRTPLTPLTCPDTCPDMSADTCPDVSGRRSDGGH
jgi:hypothetical protein